jgi:hypothetical protein
MDYGVSSVCVTSTYDPCTGSITVRVVDRKPAANPRHLPASDEVAAAGGSPLVSQPITITAPVPPAHHGAAGSTSLRYAHHDTAGDIANVCHPKLVERGVTIYVKLTASSFTSISIKGKSSGSFAASG